MMPRFQTRFHMPRLRVMALCALCLLGLGTGEVNATKTAPVAQANEPQRATLVFGIVSKEGAMGTHRDGINAFDAINQDYLVNIANALKLKVELKGYPTVYALLDAIERDEVVGAVGFSRTEERAKRFIFSKSFFTSSVAVWYADRHLAKHAPESLAWSCIRGTSHCEQLKSAGIDNIHYARDLDDAKQAMELGLSDALISSFVVLNTFLDGHDIVKGTLATPEWVKSEKVRLITTAKYQSLVDRVNQVLNLEEQGDNVRSIVSDNPYHSVELKLNDFQRTHSAEQPITYSAATTAYPFLFRGEDGKLDGFLHDFFQLLRSRTGLEFTHVEPDHLDEGSLSGYNADLVPVAYTDEKPMAKWQLTEPFLSLNYVAVTREGDVPQHQGHDIVGVLTSSEHQGFVHLTGWRDRQIKQYDTLKTLIADLKSQAIDFAYIPKDIAHGLVVRSDVGGLEINEREPLKVHLAFAVKNSPQLKRLLDSVFSTIDVNEMAKLMRGYRQINFIYGYDDKQVVQVAGAVLTLVLLAALLTYFIISNLRLKVGLAEASANQEENEKEWLKTIISELDSWVFIHDSRNQMVLSNCEHVQRGDCNGCTVASRSAQSPLVDNAQEVERVLAGELIADYHQTQDCRLSVSHIFRQRKMITSPSSNNRFVLTVLNDITEHKAKEAELLKAKQHAQEAVVSRERFLATMSHELRTPIAAAQGLLELMQTKPLHSDVSELVEQAKQSTRHLNQLVDEVLDFSKLHANQLRVNPVETDLLQVVGETVRSFESAAQSKGLECRVAFLPFAQRYGVIDDVRVVQIINNLMSNAIKFTQTGFIKIDASATDRALNVTVSDSGIGMTRAQIEKIFQPFTQADDGVTRQFGGTGLGLSIVDKLVACMGGSLNVESIVNVGSVFRLQLPLKPSARLDPILRDVTYNESGLPVEMTQWFRAWGMKACEGLADVMMLENHHLQIRGLNDDVHEMPSQHYRYPHMVLKALTERTRQTSTSTSAAKDAPASPALSGRVLVAEDNLINQNIIAMQLAELGVDAKIVDNGEQALAYLAQHQDIDVLLTDFHMPIMDGFALTRHIRQDSTLSALPVIGLTAEDSRVATELASQSGLDHVLCKPYSMAQLRALLGLYLPEEANETRAMPAWLAQLSESEQAEFAALFVQSMNQDLKVLRDSDDMDVLRKAIHSIKGGLAAVGLTSLVTQCQHIEHSSAHSFSQGVASLIDSLTQEVAAVDRWRTQS
ncbi:transporter substrate-binding domain-containing protein [Vibrio scophthalmi]|uniref:ATP-binding protein n=1 Tax=Vibrio scophthalmi TaxID=45658 RepID=UPI002FF2789D